jgi:hypothetical protein
MDNVVFLGCLIMLFQLQRLYGVEWYGKSCKWCVRISEVTHGLFQGSVPALTGEIEKDHKNP